jgi:hypothetical protein
VVSVNWCLTRLAIGWVARLEERQWTQADGKTKISEGDPGRLSALTSYWSAVPGFSDPAVALGAAQRSARNENGWEWSAAFICFVMRRAGIQSSHGFAFGRKHMAYIVGALRNRENRDRARPFWLFDVADLQSEARPQIGDLLCFNREVRRRPGQPAQWTRHTVASLRRQFWEGGNQRVQPFGFSHCSLVVGAGSDASGNRFVQTIGGNERHSVRLRQTVPLDASGRIPNPQAHHIFGMIKLIEC